jgi:hypothetical protein
MPPNRTACALAVDAILESARSGVTVELPYAPPLAAHLRRRATDIELTSGGTHLRYCGRHGSAWAVELRLDAEPDAVHE